MDKSNKGYLILLFFISPFFGLMNIFKLKKEKDLLFFGTLFFGLAGSLFVYKDGADGFAHRLNATANYSDMSLLDFFERSYLVLTFNAVEGSTDIYIHIISFISASIFQMPELIHVLAGLVLGYFFTKSVLLVLGSQLNEKKGYILLGFIALFLLIRSISAINSIRMWTGMWVLFYGTYSYAIKKDKKYIFISLFSIFVHFSYAIIIIPVIGGYLLQNRKKILVGMYVVSFFTTIGFSAVESYIPQSKLIENKQNGYGITSEADEEFYELKSQRVQAANNDANFYKGFGQNIYFSFSIVGLSMILILFYLKKDVGANLKFLIALGLSIYLFSNLVDFSPSLQFRSKMIASTFILAAAIQLQLTLQSYRLRQRAMQGLNIGFVAFLISSIPVALFHISYILSITSFFIFFFPEIAWLLGDGDYSIRGLIGLLID